jgi:hypothetical protein
MDLLKEDSVVTTTKEVEVPLTDEDPADNVQVKSKKSKKRKDRGKDRERSKGKIPDRQCVVM